MYTHQKLQSEKDHTAVLRTASDSTSAHLSQGAQSYLASLQQTSKALQDGRIDNVLDERANKNDELKRRGIHSSGNATFAHTNTSVTDSVRGSGVERSRDSLASISSVVSELWQQRNRETKDTPLKEIRICDAEELSESSTTAEITLSHKGSKKRKNGDAAELHTTVSDGDLHEHSTATSAVEKKKERMRVEYNKADQKGNELAATHIISLDKLERRTSVDMTSRADDDATQKLIEESIFGSSNSAKTAQRRFKAGSIKDGAKPIIAVQQVSKGNVYGNVSGPRLKEIRKSIDISLNSSSYAYDFDSDTSLDTLLTINSKMTPMTIRTISPSKDAEAKKTPFMNKQSPFMTRKIVHSGSSGGADSILDEIESIPEEVPLNNSIDSSSRNSPSSMISEITAAIPESGSLEDEQGGSTSGSLKVTARKQKANKQQTSQEGTEKAAPFVSETTFSTQTKQLPKESSKNRDYSTSESSNSTSASTSSSGSASTVGNLKFTRSTSDTDGSESKTSVSASAFGSIRSKSLSKTSLESVNTEKTGTGRKQFSTARPDQNRSVGNRSENAISQRWENTSDSINNNDLPQVSRRKHQEVRRKSYFNRRDVLEKGSHESQRHDKGTQTKFANNRSTRLDASEKTERCRSLKQNTELTNSRKTTSNIAMQDDVTSKSCTIRKKNIRSTSHENRSINESGAVDACRMKWDSKDDREAKMQLAISSERLRGLVRLVVDEILDGQNSRGEDQLISKMNRSAQTDFYEEPIHLSLFDALPIEYIQGNARASIESKYVPTNMLRLHIELLKREADRERRALREWDCIMHDFEQRSQVFGLDRLRRILNSKQLHNYL